MGIKKVFTATLLGIEAELVEIESVVSNGLPTTIIVGLPDTVIQESRERIRSAIKQSGFSYPQTRVSLNLAPSDLPKIGTSFDLPMALAILLASESFKLNLTPAQFAKCLFVGELSLDGKIRGSSGCLAKVMVARDNGFNSVFVPVDSSDIVSLVEDIHIYPVESLGELVDHLTGNKLISALPLIRKMKENLSANTCVEVNFLDIAGQEFAKRALEVVAAGAHNILMTGPPGSGKTMLARALPGILPPLQSSEMLELCKIYNSTNRVSSSSVSHRPVRSPHHTISQTGLIGGGTIPYPGEVTFAHLGVLFLDELPEFSSAALEVLRQPLEENKITITRSRRSFVFPANFVLVAAQNPCPCGNFGQLDLECSCSLNVINKYQKKISGPLLDRIDLHINVPRLKYKEIMTDQSKSLQGNSSETIAERVLYARKIQHTRFGKIKTNSEISAQEINKFCKLDSQTSVFLETAADNYKLSGRAIHRILKVARTIADLDGSSNIQMSHIAESIQYRLSF